MNNKENNPSFTTNVFFNLIISSKKDKVDQGQILDRLSRVFKLQDKKTDYTEETFKTYSTRFRQGKDPLIKFFGFGEPTRHEKFMKDIEKDQPISLALMKSLVDETIDTEQYNGLVECMLSFIKDDDTIKDEDEFYLFEIKTFVCKEVFCSFIYYNIDSFLLSVWMYLIQGRYKYTNKKSFHEYFEPKDSLRSINKLERPVNVCRYFDYNEKLAKEYSRFKKKENKLSGNITFFEENDHTDQSLTHDFDLLCGFRKDYNKILEFIIDLDLDNARFGDFISYDFLEFREKVRTLNKKWDDKKRYNPRYFKGTNNEELIDDIKRELKNYFETIDMLSGDARGALIEKKNQIADYHCKLNFGVPTFDNLNNN